jgi:hypothetical protein
MEMTTQEAILLRNKIEAWQEARDYAHKTSMALTIAKAQTEEVNSKGGSWLKHAFTSDPGTIEQIELRLANTLNSIGEPPEFDDPILEIIAMKGFYEGFDSGEFEVEANLFAIDTAVMLIEFAAMEIALGPLGGAKFLASAVSKGSKALKAAMVRLGDIPIFIPGAAGGAGAFVRAGNVLKNLSRYHARRLEKAMFAEAERLGKPLVKLVTDETHHVVAHGSKRPFAIECRKILEKFGVDIDHAANGVFLPAYKSSPNPKGSIVHKILGNNDKYYETMYKFLKDATSEAEVIQKLRRIGEALEKGTFFNAPL